MGQAIGHEPIRGESVCQEEAVECAASVFHHVMVLGIDPTAMDPDDENWPDFPSRFGEAAYLHS